MWTSDRQPLIVKILKIVWRSLAALRKNSKNRCVPMCRYIYICLNLVILLEDYEGTGKVFILGGRRLTRKPRFIQGLESGPRAIGCWAMCGQRQHMKAVREHTDARPEDIGCLLPLLAPFMKDPSGLCFCS